MRDPAIAGPVSEPISIGGARKLETMSLGELLYWVLIDRVKDHPNASSGEDGGDAAYSVQGSPHIEP